MKQIYIRFFSAILFLLCSYGTGFAQGDMFTRQAVIPVPSVENGGFGNIVSGVDLDGDGKIEIYAVNDNWTDSGSELIPRIYKYEKNGNDWDSVWSATLNIPLQNTWPSLAVGDLDKDGKKEIIWGPVNNLNTTSNPNPARIVVFEVKGDGSDILGIDAGGGNYAPNADWNLDLTDNTNMRPFRWVITDIDQDSTDEIVFSDRASKLHYGVVSVNNIPDNGDGSETWTLEASANNTYTGFLKTSTIDVPPHEPGGWGNVVTGVDFDADGRMDLYAVNDNWNDTPEELIPRIYKYEFTGADWELVWMTEVNIPKQNTWPPLVAADWDKDGKMEIIWGVVNFIEAGNSNPPRVLVFEEAGDGSDIMGVADGDKYKPNATYTITANNDVNLRPFDWEFADVDNDGTGELIYVDRTGGSSGSKMSFGILSVSNIPDNADGSETWTVEASGESLGLPPVNMWDLAIIDNTIYFFDVNAKVYPVRYTGGAYTLLPAKNTFPSGSPFKSASVIDVDGDGSKEILMGNYGSASAGGVFLLKPSGDSLAYYKIADLSSFGATRLVGGAAGNIDGDTFADFITADRAGSNVYHIEYLGGDITNAASWSASVLDKSIVPEGGQLDVILLANLDADAESELVYTGIPRNGVVLPVVVGNYGTFAVAGGAKYDLAVVDNVIYLFEVNGKVTPVKYEDGVYKPMPVQLNVVGSGGSFKSAEVVDIDKDGTMEILAGEYNSSALVYVLQPNAVGYLRSAAIGNPTVFGASRVTGGASGDLDGDGNIDYVFGARDAVPNSPIYRLEYKGGEINDPANYSLSVIDSGIVAAGGQTDIVTVANMDADADLEVVYSGIPRDSGPLPIVVLDLQKVQATPIADVKVDANGDFVPDNVDATFTIMGVVTSVNVQKNSADLGIYLQDETGGILIFANNDDSSSYAIGRKLQITGKVAHYNGLTELIVEDTPVNIVDLGVGTLPEPVLVKIDDFNKNGEMYEGLRVRINGIAKKSGTWPDSTSTSSGATLTMWDGIKSFAFRIDNDTDLKMNPEPEYPINVVGVASQFDNSAPYDGGYQLLPMQYSDIEAKVAAPPSPYFSLLTPADGAVIEVTDSTQQFSASWTKSVDLNNDAVIYQFMLLQPAFTSKALNDSVFTFDGIQALKWLGTEDTLKTRWTIRAKGKEQTIVPSVDTLDITFVKNIVSSVADQNIPQTFFVDQNYPNPFNPSTTIKFGLPSQMNVDLRIYNSIGEEVAVLISGQQMNAGTYYHSFNASRLASGTYIYRLQAGPNMITKKMLLLK